LGENGMWRRGAHLVILVCVKELLPSAVNKHNLCLAEEQLVPVARVAASNLWRAKLVFFNKKNGLFCFIGEKILKVCPGAKNKDRLFPKRQNKPRKFT